MKPMRAVACVLVGVLAVAVGRAGEWQSQEFNCGATLTDESGWTDVTSKVAAQPSGVPNGRVALAMGRMDSPEHGVSFSILVIANQGQTRITSLKGAAGAKLEQGFLNAAGVKQSSRNLEVYGLPAFEVAAVSQPTAPASSVLVRFILTEKFIYAINCTRIGDRQPVAGDLLRMMQSFRFLNQPAAPASRMPMILGGGLVVGLVIVLVVVVRSRKSRPAAATMRRPSAPPPVARG